MVLLVYLEDGRQTLRVELDLTPDMEPICGHIRDADGAEHLFTGWLELIQMLEHLRSSQASNHPMTSQQEE